MHEQYEKVKDRGLEFENYDFWLRYVGDNYSAKIQQSIKIIARPALLY